MPNDKVLASDAVAAATAGAAGPLAPGTWLWRGQARDQLQVRLQFVPGSRIEVGLWWNRESGPADVQLIFGLYDESVELGSLQGNGFNAPGFHQAGFGTLAVNVAVQVLQANFAPTVRIEGVLSNTDEFGLPEERRLPLEESRRAFWRRFGLGVVRRGEPAYDYLHGTVADLHTVVTGQVAGQFPRCIPLSAFTRAG